MTEKSLLFVPAKEKMLKKIVSFDADGYIVDLEDSIIEQDKSKALLEVKNFLKTPQKKRIWVRVNSDKYEEEISVLENFEVGFMLPKIKNTMMYKGAQDILDKHHVIALIESPEAVIYAEKIATINYVDALAFGAEDYCAEMRMDNNEKNLMYVRSKLVNCARAFHKDIYDTPSFKLNNEEDFKAEVKLASDMGFDGKLAINPKQISYINKIFDTSNLEWMLSVVRQYEKSDDAVQVINGIVYENMHIERMKEELKKKGVW